MKKLFSPGASATVKRMGCCLKLFAAAVAVLTFLRVGPEARAAESGAEVRPVGPHLFQVGKALGNAAERSIEFPAEVNMTNGVIEYLVVHSLGKVHESVFRTETEPYHIHLAALLLSPSADAKATNRLFNVRVRWMTNGVVREASGESFILDLKANAAMREGPWAYQGSRLVDGAFLAQRDGSIITTRVDEDALLGNPRPGREDEENWLVMKPFPLPAKFPVTLILKSATKERE